MSQPVGTEENAPSTETQNGNVNESNESTLTLEQAHAELKKVRQEAASRRIELKAFKDKADQWDQYTESQKTELQKLQDQLADKDKAIAAKELEVTRANIAKEFNVEDDDLDLLVGDEENMKRLARRLGKSETPGTATPKSPADLFGGNRGKPVGDSGGTFSMNDFIRGLAK